MAANQPISEATKRLFVRGKLSPEEHFKILQEMEENPVLREEIQILEAMLQVEKEQYIAKRMARTSDLPKTGTTETRVIPLYKKTWLQVAASLVLLLVIGGIIRTRLQSADGTLLTRIPVLESATGSLGWGPDAKATQEVITRLITDPSGSLRYQFYDDTLRIFLPEAGKSLLKDRALYLVDDLQHRRLLLILHDRKYPITGDTREITPLIESD